MTQDISGFGSLVTIVASNTYPAGIPITQFSDDADALDFPSIAIADATMGVNGDLITWSKANPLPLTLSVIPGSDDDIALGILAEANRVGKGKTSARDSISLTVIYPDASIITFSQGVLLEAQFGKGIASTSRLKTKTYAFKFENKVGG